MAKTKANATKEERKAAATKARKCHVRKDEVINDEGTTGNSSVLKANDTMLMKALKKLGATVGPINDSTRSLYQRRLNCLMKTQGISQLSDIVNDEEEVEKNEEGRAVAKRLPVRRSVMKTINSEEEETEDREDPSVPLEKKREPSVLILVAKTNEIKRREANKIVDNRAHGIEEIVIDETRGTLRDMDTIGEEDETLLDSDDDSCVLRIEDEIVENEDAEGYYANGTYIMERKEEEIEWNASDHDDDTERIMESGEENEDADCNEHSVVDLTEDKPIKEGVRRNRTRYEDEVDRKKTMDIFIRRSRDSHQTTMDVFNERESSHRATLDGRDERDYTQLLNRDITLILEESEKIDISNNFGDEKIDSRVCMTSDDLEQKSIGDISLNLCMDTEDMEISLEDMEISLNSRDQTTTVHRKHEMMPVLIVDTPKTSRITKEKNDTNGSRHIRSKIDKEVGESGILSSLHSKNQNLRWEERKKRIVLSQTTPSIYPLKSLEDSIGMETFNNGVEKEGMINMNSTRNYEAQSVFGTTFIINDSKKSPEAADDICDATFIIEPAMAEIGRMDKEEKKSTIRVSRNIARSPSRDHRRTYVVSRSPSRMNNGSKSPIRHRNHPVPLPRRILLNKQDGTIPPPSRALPIPAPRRFVPKRIEKEDGKNRNESEKIMGERREEEVSPVSFYNIQPAVRVGKERATKEPTRSNIDEDVNGWEQNGEGRSLGESSIYVLIEE